MIATTREIAERYVRLLNPDCLPVGAIQQVEDMIEGEEWLAELYDNLDEIIKNAPDYADEAKEVKYSMEMKDNTLLPF